MQQNTTEEPSVQNAQGAYLLGLFLAVALSLRLINIPYE